MKSHTWPSGITTLKFRQDAAKELAAQHEASEDHHRPLYIPAEVQDPAQF
jgi:hypothetical protein